MANQETTSSESVIAEAVQGLFEPSNASPGPILSFIRHGIAITAEHCDKLATVNHTSEALAPDVAYQFSTITNTLPPAKGIWSTTGRRLDELYRYWLEHALVPRNTLIPEVDQGLSGALNTLQSKTPQYQTAKARFFAAKNALEDAHRKRAEFRILLPLQAEFTRARTEWQAQGAKTAVETAHAKVTDHHDRTLSILLANLRERFNRTLANNRSSNGTHFLPVNLNSLTTIEHAAWTHCKFSSAKTGSLELWTCATTGQAITTVSKLLENWCLAFDVLRVPLERSSWFDTTLFQSRAWWWPTATRQCPTQGGPLFSDGCPPPSTAGCWPLTPVEVVFARDLVLEGPEPSLSLFLQSAHGAAEAGIGPFRGQCLSPSAFTGPYHFKRESSTRLRALQMQMIAFCCQLMPKSPNPDPTLLLG